MNDNRSTPIRANYAWMWSVPLFIVILGLWWLLGSNENGYESVNALFSGLAFGGVIVAIVLQSQELRLQNEELRLQRQELEDTREELRKSAEAQKELVRLASLTNLTQCYLHKYNSNIKDNEFDYKHKLMFDTQNVEATVRYKVDIYFAQLEEAYAFSSGGRVGLLPIVDIANRKQRLWMREFEELKMHLDNSLKEYTLTKFTKLYPHVFLETIRIISQSISVLLQYDNRVFDPADSWRDDLTDIRSSLDDIRKEVSSTFQEGTVSMTSINDKPYVSDARGQIERLIVIFEAATKKYGPSTR